MGYSQLISKTSYCQMTTPQHLSRKPLQQSMQKPNNTMIQQRTVVFPPLGIGNFVYTKPSLNHKSGPWIYGLVTAILTPQSYIIETPIRLTQRNWLHLRPAAPPPPEALISWSWMKQLSAKTPINSSKQPKPVMPPSPPKGPRQTTTTNPTQASPAKTAPRPLTASTQNAPQSEANLTSPMESNTKGTVTYPPNGSNTQSSQIEGTLTKTRSGRVSKPVIHLGL